MKAELIALAQAHIAMGNALLAGIGAAGGATSQPAAAAAVATGPTLDQAKAAMKSVIDAPGKGKEAAVAIFASFGAKKLGDVTPDKYAALIAACTAKLTEPAPAAADDFLK